MQIWDDKVVELIRSFSGAELNRFGKFLLSPYFNENERISEMFSVLADYVRQDMRHARRTDAWKRVFGNKPFEEQKYRRICSDLTKLAYRFLSVETLEKDAIASSAKLLGGLNSVELHKHYLTALRNLRREQERDEIRNADFHFYKFQSEYESHVHLERMKASRKTLSNLQASDRHLDMFYLINKLKHYCDSLNYKTFLNIGIDIRLLPALLQFIEENGYLEDPAVEIYYVISKTINDRENSDWYYKLVGLLETHFRIFPKTELRMLYVYATNYCIQHINLGEKSFYRELYQLYFTLLEKRIIFSDADELDERHFKNIITLGIRLGDFEGVEGVIREYTPLLKKEHRDNAFTFNLAQMYHAKGEFGKVIEQLRTVEYQDIFYALGSTLLLLKTYYELGEHTAMEAHIDSFRIYLRRNKLVAGSVKTQYLNFLRFVKKMYSLPRYAETEVIKLREKIKDTKLIINKEWLLMKLETDFVSAKG